MASSSHFLVPKHETDLTTDLSIKLKPSFAFCQIFDMFYRNFLTWLRNNDDVSKAFIAYLGSVRTGWGNQNPILKTVGVFLLLGCIQHWSILGQTSR